MVSNGRKWALISKILTGRNEHAVKNKFISILRLLKKHDKIVNPNDFQEVLDTFKKVQIYLDPNKIEEISKLSLQKSESLDDISLLYNIQNDILNLELSSTLNSQKFDNYSSDFFQQLLPEKPQGNFPEIFEENDFLTISNNDINRSLLFDL